MFSSQGQSELVLLQKVQEYCYDNIHFMKAFQKIVVLFYKGDVLSEEAILKRYKEAHAAKGKSVFLDQMKKFVEWLQNAEEGRLLLTTLTVTGQILGHCISGHLPLTFLKILNVPS